MKQTGLFMLLVVGYLVCMVQTCRLTKTVDNISQELMHEISCVYAYAQQVCRENRAMAYDLERHLKECGK